MKARDLAHAIVNYAQSIGLPVSNLKLQKLMFFCELSNYKNMGQKLIEDEQFEAWDYGPVIRNIYIEFAIYGADNITKHFDNVQQLPYYLELTLNKWLSRAPWELAGRSHIKNGAWDLSYNNVNKRVIPDSYIQMEAENYGI